MTKIAERLLFYISPIVLILLICSSGEKILIIFVNTPIEKILYSLSRPNSIIFNLSVGYLSGLFIYYLTGYIPNKTREKQQIIITTRLLSLLNSRINGLFSLILKCSTEKEPNMENVNSERFQLICKNCNINQPSGAKKVLSTNSFSLGDILVRENLLMDWEHIVNHLNEIDNAAIYIEPEIYDLCLKIRKCSLSYSISHLQITQMANTDLEAWSSQFFDLYQLKTELEKRIKKLHEK
jgi:hypothetical protein